MSDKIYEVVFRGRVLRGHDVAVVKQKLAKLFKIDEATAEKLFSGQRITVKKGLDAATAKKYRDVLRQAGANASIVTVGGSSAPAQVAKSPSPPAPEQKTSQSGEARAAPEPSAVEPEAPVAEPEPAVSEPEPEPEKTGPGWQLDPLGTVIVEATKTETPQLDLSDLSMAEVGEVFDTPKQVAQPEFNFAEFTVDDPGQTIVTPEVVEPVEYDLSQLSAAEAGEVLPQPDPVAEPEIDVSGMEMAESGVQLVAKPDVAPADIQTDHLELEAVPEPPAPKNPFLTDSD